MKAEIISVGTEILMGEITNTNARYIAEKMKTLGINVYYQTTVGDNHQRLEATIRQAMNRSDIIITTGGLGPTSDDITLEVIGRALNTPLVLYPDWVEYLKEVTAKFGVKLTENNIKQAYMPEGSIPIPNPQGTAPGVYIETENKTIIAFPGPPMEMKAVFDEGVYSKLAEKSQEHIYSHRIKVMGIGEAPLEDIIRDLIEAQTDPTIALYAQMGEVHIRLATKATAEKEAREKLQPAKDEIVARIGDNILGFDEDTIEAKIGELLNLRGLKLVTAESCTGGLLGHRLTNVSGSSEYYLGGLVTYSNSLKEKLLHVPVEVLEQFGAVSAETAVEMARGALKTAEADVAISVTGIAGPGGGSQEKPVGTVYFGIVGRGIEPKYYHRLLIGKRDEIKYRSTQMALYYLWKTLKEFVHENTDADTGKN